MSTYLLINIIRKLDIRNTLFNVVCFSRYVFHLLIFEYTLLTPQLENRVIWRRTPPGRSIHQGGGQKLGKEGDFHGAEGAAKNF